jgi:hypothetical protein
MRSYVVNIHFLFFGWQVFHFSYQRCFLLNKMCAKNVI